MTSYMMEGGGSKHSQCCGQTVKEGGPSASGKEYVDIKSKLPSPA